MHSTSAFKGSNHMPSIAPAPAPLQAHAKPIVAKHIFSIRFFRSSVNTPPVTHAHTCSAARFQQHSFHQAIAQTPLCSLIAALPQSGLLQHHPLGNNPYHSQEWSRDSVQHIHFTSLTGPITKLLWWLEVLWYMSQGPRCLPAR
jgi:hypothetical protein